MKRAILTSILIYFLLNQFAFGQQEVLYTQYIYNELTINPAYAGYQDALNITLNSRKQWIGLEGSPLTVTLAGHTVLNSKNPECNIFKMKRGGRLKPSKNNNKIGLGILIYNDQIGVDNTLMGSFSYSYKIMFKESRLSFGLQGSVINYSQDFISLEDNDLSDPVFDENVEKLMVNFGAGLFFDNDRYYFGLSMPQTIKNSLDNSSESSSYQLRQFFVTGGYIFYLSRTIKYKPTFMFRYTEDIPFQVDLNSTIIFRDSFYLGLSYRNNNSLSTILQMNFNERMRIGLAYDYNIVKEFKKVANGTIEVLFYYNFRNSKHKVINPRYF